MLSQYHEKSFQYPKDIDLKEKMPCMKSISKIVKVPCKPLKIWS
jgi:hypothetical protein